MIEITWLGHASFQFKTGSGEVILVDPWLDGNPSFPKGYEVERVDTILITHGHFDHVASVMDLAKRFKPLVIANYEICTWLGSKGVENASGMNKGGKQKAGSAMVTMTHALHSSGIAEDGKLIYGGEAAGYVVRFDDGRSVYVSGDTAVFSDMALIGEMYKPELAILPIGDHYTMGPDEAAVACRLLKVKKVIPVHFGTFPILVGRPEELAAKLKDASVDTTVWALEPGKPAAW